MGGDELKYVVYTSAIFYTWLLRGVGMLTMINITYTRRSVLGYSLAYARARKTFHPGIAAVQLARGAGSEPLQKKYSHSQRHVCKREGMQACLYCVRV